MEPEPSDNEPDIPELEALSYFNTDSSDGNYDQMAMRWTGSLRLTKRL